MRSSSGANFAASPKICSASSVGNSISAGGGGDGQVPRTDRFDGRFLHSDRDRTWCETERHRKGEFVAQGTIGPAKNGLGVVLGGTGEFADARGYMMEENVYLGFDGIDYDVRTQLTFFLE